MKTIHFAVIAGVIGWASLPEPASALPLTGSQLQGLTYTTTGGLFNGNAATSAYVATGGGYANLYTPNGNQSEQLATVTVPNGYDGVSLGTLNSLITAGAAGQVSFNLLSEPISTTPPIWVVTLADPKNNAITMTFDTFNAVPDESGGEPIIGTNFFDQGGSTMAASSSMQGNLFALWTQIAANDTDDGSLLGTWAVASVGVEIGTTENTAPEEVEIGGFNLPGTPLPVPDTASTLTMILGGIALAGLSSAKRLRSLCG